MGREPNPTPRKANRRGFTLHSAGEGPVTLPIRRADLNAFPHLETRRERRAALRDWKKAIANYQKLVEQAHKDDTIKHDHVAAVTGESGKAV